MSVSTETASPREPGLPDRPVRRSWWIRVHVLTGLVPLAVYCVFHVWETASGIGGREAFAGRMTGLGGSTVAVVLESLLVMLPLSVHAGLGVLRVLRGRGSRDPGPYRSHGSRRLQWLTGVGVLVFVVLHLAHTWAPKLAGAGAFGLYEGLRTQLGTPLYVTLYVVGLTCVSFHLAQGVAASVIGSGRLRRARPVVLVRLAGGLLGVALWAVSLNTLSHFVSGEAIFWQAGAAPAGTGADAP